MRHVKRLQTGADHWHKLLIESTTGYAIYMLDPGGYIRTWNSGAQKIKGYTADEALGKHLSIFYLAEDVEAGEPMLILGEALRSCHFEQESWRLRKDGTRFWASISIEPIFEEEKHVGFVKITRDLSAQHAGEAKLRRALHVAFESVTEGVAQFDETGTLSIANNQFAELLGLRPRQIRPGMSFKSIVDLFGENNADMLTPGLSARPLAGSLRRVLSHNDRNIEWQRHLLPGGEYIETLQDITQQTKVEADVKRFANYDELTELANRSFFRRLLRRHMAPSDNNHRIAVHKIDINGFASINDAFGRAVGDKVLRLVAKRLLATADKKDRVGRLGGDEFAILQTDVDGQDDARELAIRILSVLGQPYYVDGHEIFADACIGIVLIPDGREADDVDSIALKIDLALRRAQRAHASGYRFYECAVDTQMKRDRTLEQDLRRAMRRHQFEVFYQRLVSAQTGESVGYEALLRWHHPSRGLISPGEFISVAEENGLIIPIGAWALKTALREAMKWPEGLRLAVNLSAAQLKDRALPGRISEALATTGFSPERLELEITESTLIDNSEHGLATLARFQAKGIKIALDDFGTGYSSLGYLRDFHFDRLKIDRSFIQGLGSDRQSEILTRTIIGLAADFDMAVTAEGVETLAQFEQLKAIQCNEVQGFHFGKPKPAAELRSELSAFSSKQSRRQAKHVTTSPLSKCLNLSLN